VYAKIFAQIFDSSIAEDYRTRHIFMDLLVLADREGLVDMTLESIARRTNIPVDVLTDAVCKLCKPDVNSRTETEDGRRLVLIDPERAWGWRIVNFEQYHAMRDENGRRAYMRSYMRRRRAVARGDKPIVNTCKPVNTELAHADVYADAHADEDKKPPNPPKGGGGDLPDGFVRFWNAWPSHPRKTSKGACLTRWKRDGLEKQAAKVIDVVDALKVSSQWQDESGKFIPAPLVWLNQRRWDCDVDELRAAITAKTQPAWATAYLESLDEHA